MAPSGTSCHLASAEGEMNENKVVMTLADVLSLLEQSGLTGTRRRDMVSALKRICEMAGDHAGRGDRPTRAHTRVAVSHSTGRPRRHRQELLEPEKPSSRRASACRRHRPPRPGDRQTPPRMGTAAGSHSRRPAPVERAGCLRELVRGPGHLTGRGERHNRSAIPGLA